MFRAFNRESGETGWSKAGKVEQEVSSELMLESLACIEAKSNLAVKCVASRGLSRYLHIASQMKGGEQSGVTF